MYEDDEKVQENKNLRVRHNVTSLYWVVKKFWREARLNDQNLTVGKRNANWAAQKPSIMKATEKTPLAGKNPLVFCLITDIIISVFISTIPKLTWP